MKALQTITTRASALGLQFLVAGGHAVIAHGHQRTTFDLDLIIRRDDLESWSTLAQDLGYQRHHEGPTFVQFNPKRPRELPLDLMLVNAQTFSKLAAASIPLPQNLESTRMVSLKHLLALKCHAIKHGHSGRIIKDADDVIRLVQANGLDLLAPEIREIFLTHGTTEFYEKVKSACSSD